MKNNKLMAARAIDDFFTEHGYNSIDVYQSLEKLSESSLLYDVRLAIKADPRPVEIRADYMHKLPLGGNFWFGERVFSNLSSETGLKFSAVQPSQGNEYGAYKAIVIPHKSIPLRLYLGGKVDKKVRGDGGSKERLESLLADIIKEILTK